MPCQQCRKSEIYIKNNKATHPALSDYKVYSHSEHSLQKMTFFKDLKTKNVDADDDMQILYKPSDMPLQVE